MLSSHSWPANPRTACALSPMPADNVVAASRYKSWRPPLLPPPKPDHRQKCRSDHTKHCGFLYDPLIDAKTSIDLKVSKYWTYTELYSSLLYHDPASTWPSDHINSQNTINTFMILIAYWMRIQRRSATRRVFSGTPTT